jgi:uncharacterized protein (TIGR02266 family)
MTSERRRHARLSLEVEVDLSTENNFYTAKTRDVSMGGLFIASPVGLAAGTPVKVKLALGKKTLELATKVAWALNGPDGNPVGFGVEFVELAPNAARAIEGFMKKRDPMAFGILSETDGEMLDDDERTPVPAPSVAKPPPLPSKG